MEKKHRVSETLSLDHPTSSWEKVPQSVLEDIFSKIGNGCSHHRELAQVSSMFQRTCQSPRSWNPFMDHITIHPRADGKAVTLYSNDHPPLTLRLGHQNAFAKSMTQVVVTCLEFTYESFDLARQHFDNYFYMLDFSYLQQIRLHRNLLSLPESLVNKINHGGCKRLQTLILGLNSNNQDAQKAVVYWTRLRKLLVDTLTYMDLYYEQDPPDLDERILFSLVGTNNPAKLRRLQTLKVADCRWDFNYQQDQTTRDILNLSFSTHLQVLEFRHCMFPHDKPVEHFHLFSQLHELKRFKFVSEFENGGYIVSQMISWIRAPVIVIALIRETSLLPPLFMERIKGHPFVETLRLKYMTLPADCSALSSLPKCTRLSLRIRFLKLDQSRLEFPPNLNDLKWIYTGLDIIMHDSVYLNSLVLCTSLTSLYLHDMTFTTAFLNSFKQLQSLTLVDSNFSTIINRVPQTVHTLVLKTIADSTQSQLYNLRDVISVSKCPIRVLELDLAQETDWDRVINELLSTSYVIPLQTFKVTWHFLKSSVLVSHFKRFDQLQELTIQYDISSKKLKDLPDQSLEKHIDHNLLQFISPSLRVLKFVCVLHTISPLLYQDDVQAGIIYLLEKLMNIRDFPELVHLEWILDNQIYIVTELTRDVFAHYSKDLHKKFPKLRILKLSPNNQESRYF